MSLAPIWPNVTLAHRGDPEHKVRRLHALYIVTWEDGTIFPFSVSIPAEVMEGGVINDAFAAMQLVSQFKAFQEAIYKEGLDQMHDKYGENFGGDGPYDVLMGAMIKVIPQLRPELHLNLQKWMRLIQAVINPPIPPHVKAKLEQRRQQELQQRRPVKGPQGGFDE